MTALTHDAEKLRELDLDTCQAWRAYSQRLSGLEGEEYESAEAESWDELQRELRRVDRKRKLLVRASA